MNIIVFGNNLDVYSIFNLLSAELYRHSCSCYVSFNYVIALVANQQLIFLFRPSFLHK